MAEEDDEAGVPAGLCLNIDDARRLPQVVARGMVKEMDDGFLVMGTPIKYGTWNSYGTTKDAPALNADNDQIRADFE